MSSWAVSLTKTPLPWSTLPAVSWTVVVSISDFITTNWFAYTTARKQQLKELGNSWMRAAKGRCCISMFARRARQVHRDVPISGLVAGCRLKCRWRQSRQDDAEQSSACLALVASTLRSVQLNPTINTNPKYCCIVERK